MEWINIFNGVLFPLVQELLKTENVPIDSAGIIEMRVQASQLICKTFLHYLTLLYNNWDGIVPLWKDILAAMERLILSGGRGVGISELQEAARESLKNVLLVMANGDYLIPPPAGPTTSATPASAEEPTIQEPASNDDRSDAQKQLWQATSDILGRFAPALIKDVFDNPHQQLPLSPRFPPVGGAKGPSSLAAAAAAAPPTRQVGVEKDADKDPAAGADRNPEPEVLGLGVRTDES